MNEPADGVPEIVISERSKRTTTEFCTDCQEGYRCMLVKGHDGVHECLATDGLAQWTTLDDPEPAADQRQDVTATSAG